MRPNVGEGRPALGRSSDDGKVKGLQVTWTSSTEKKHAGSPKSVVAGAWTDRGETGRVNELRTT